MPLICQALLSFRSQKDAYLFLLLAGAGVVSLFPLFTALPELLTKTAVAGSYLAFAFATSRLGEGGHRGCTGGGKSDVSVSGEVEGHSLYRYRLHVLGAWAALGLLVVAVEGVHPLLVAPRWPFAPLMATSTACGAVLCACWWASLQLMLGEA